MVSRIEVIPSEVRGYGNIIEAKSVEDFVPVESDLVYSENVYSLTALEGLRITLTASSSSISYGSSVSLSATVVEDDEPVTGVSVSFYDGSTSLGSATTNSNGVATYTTSSLTVGSHSCTAVYDEKTSNSVSVTVNKLASTISLTVPASGTVGTSYTISGTLVPTSGSVKLYENGSLKDTLTVSSGSFSKAVTQDTEGTYSYYAVFEGSSTYESVTSSTGSIVVSDVPTPSYDGVSLTSDKSILSYADSESATLTAQLLDGSSSASVSGVTVEFFKGSTSLGTATTNSSGVATKSYSSTGAGDVSLTASVGTFVSETYSIEDCFKYDSASTDKVSDYTVPSGLSMSWSTDHYTVTSTVQADRFIDFVEVGSEDFEMSALINTTNRNMGLSIYTDSTHTIGLYGVSSGTGFMYKNGGSPSSNRTSSTLTNNIWYKYTLSKTGSTYTGTIETLDGTVFGTWTQTVANFTKTALLSVWSVSMQIKEIKVKPL